MSDFTYNGQPLNKAYEVVVDNMINDSFFVTFNYPLDDKGIYKIIEKDKIVKVHTPDGMQPFRIMDRVKYMDHISVEAWPLFYADMRNKLVKPLMIRELAGQAAVNTFVNNLLIDTPFTFTSNITDAHDYHTQDTDERESNPNQLYNALDVFKDIVTRWRGELVINGYDIRMLDRLGKNTGALLYEKKNISDFTDEESIQGVTTRLYGKSEWTERVEGSNQEIKHKISVKVESPLIDAYSGIVFEKQYTNNDIRTEKEMKDWLNLKFTTENIDKPSRNIKVATNIVDDTVIDLGDSLMLKYVKHDVDMEIRMVGYTYDGYANRYITIQLGDAKQSYVGNVQNTVREIETNVNTAVKQTVNQILNANGERMIYSVTEPVGNFKNGDVWYDQQGGMYFWDEESGMWIDHPYNRNMNVMAEEVGKAISSAEEAKRLAVSEADAALSQAKADATAKANAIKEQVSGEVNTAISTAEDAKALAVSEAERALSQAKADATAKVNAVKTEVSNSVNTAINTANDAKQTAVDNYNNAVAEAGRLVGEQTKAFDTKLGEIEDSVDTFNQSVSDVDAKADDALEKSGANANLLTTHQNTLDTINTVTLPDISSTAGTALANAKSAMDEANKADGKIADYVTKNGLVNGTTVDTKINDATGEISKRITTVESKIPTSLGGRNYLLNSGKSQPLSFSANNSSIDRVEVGVENGLDWVTGVNVASGGFSINQYSTPTYKDGVGTNYSEDLSQYSGLMTYSMDVMSPQPVTLGLGETVFFGSSHVKLEPNKWTRISWTYERRDRPASIQAYSDNNKEIPVGTKVYWKNYKIEKEDIATDHSLAPEDNLSQSEFQIFESTYDENVKGINSRLLAIDSGKEGSLAYRLNETESTASGNTITISNIKTKPGEQITGYQKIEETANLFSRTVGENATTPDGVKDNISRIVQASEIIQQEISKGASKNLIPYWEEGGIIFENGSKYSATDRIRSGLIYRQPNRSATTNAGTTYTFSNDGVKEPIHVVRYRADGSFYDYMGMVSTFSLTDDVPYAILVMQGGSLTNKYQLEAGQEATYYAAPSSNNIGSTFTQLADNIDLRVSKSGLLSEINVQAGGVLITSGTNKLNITPDTTFIQDATIKSAMIDTVHVKKLSGTSAEFTEMVTGALKADVITSTMLNANEAMFSKLFATKLATDKLVAQGAWITDANIVSLDAGTIKSGTIATARLDAKAIVTGGLDADIVKSTHIESSVSLIDKIFANEALITRLTSNTIFASKIKAINIDAARITSGELDAARIKSKDVVTAGLSANVVEATHIKAEAGLVDKLFSTTAYIEELTNKTVFTEKIQAINISADKVTTGTLDASKVKVVNIDADNITANQAKLIQAGFESSSGGTLALSGDQLLSTASNGSQVYLQNGVVGVRRPSSEGGGSIGQIGYVFDGGSPTYTIQTAWGAHFALKQRFYDTYTKTTNEKRAMYISTGDDGETTMQFYAKDFVLQGNRNLRFGYDHYINGIGNDLTLTGKASITLRASERTIFVVSSNGEDNYASLYANLNMQGRTLTNTSDIRLKRDILNDEIDSLSALMKWQHAGFNYINPDMNQDRQFSVIAQSAPDLSFTGEDGYLQVSLNKQVNMTSHALQQHVIETNTELENLKAQIANLQDELAQLKGE